MSILPKVIFKFSAFPIKIPMAFFAGNRKINSKIHMQTQRTPTSQIILRKKEQSWKYSLDFTIYFSTLVFKSVVWAQKQTNRSMNRMKNPRTNPHI